MSELAMTTPTDPHQDPQEPLSPTARKAAFGQTFRAVVWSFLGIRRSADHEQDVKQLNPIHVVIAAVLGVAVFVVLLVVLVHFVIGAAVGTK
jgi:diacylglycerol kinase